MNNCIADQFPIISKHYGFGGPTITFIEVLPGSIVDEMIKKAEEGKSPVFIEESVRSFTWDIYLGKENRHE